jgi:hypothetical protein
MTDRSRSLSRERAGCRPDDDFRTIQIRPKDWLRDPRHDPLLNTWRQVVDSARQAIPNVSSTREHAEMGGRMSSGTDLSDLDRWPAVHDGMIIAKAAGLTVPRPTKFERIIDLHVATTLGRGVPPPIIRADEVIE